MVKISYIALLLLSFASLHAQTDRLSVVVRPDTVRFLDSGAWENCAARFRIAAALKGGEVTLTETDTVGPKLFCMCMFDLRASMTGLPAGSYTAHWYRDYRKSYGYAADVVVNIGSVVFEVTGPGGAPAVTAVEQSACDNPTEVGKPPRAESPLTFTAYPNPIDPLRHDLNLRFHSPAPGPVRIELYDILGRRMLRVERDIDPAGNREFRIPGSSLPRGGMYILVVTAGSYRGMLPILCGGRAGAGGSAPGDRIE